MKNTILIIVSITLIGIFTSSTAIAQNGCRIGGAVLANAVVRSYAEYAFFYGDLKSYISKNKTYFSSQGDSIKCARTLSAALMKNAVISYDKVALERKRDLDELLGYYTSGTPSQLYQTTSQQLSNLIPAFIAIASGNYREPTQGYSTRLQTYKYNPKILSATGVIIKEKADLDYRILISMTNNIAD